MKASERRTYIGIALLVAALGMAYAYYASLVPASHPDHDHGILNMDAGGHILVTTRDGKTWNLVGKPGKVRVVHFFSTSAPEAADEESRILAVQKSLEGDKGVEFVLIAQDADFRTVDAWLAKNNLVPPVPASITLDPTGDTTQKMNSKRPLETMVFTPEGKLSAQTRGRVENADALLARIQKARGGDTIE
jgi:hypothetical protein